MEPIIRDRKTGERLDPYTLSRPQPVLVDFLYEGREVEGVEGTITSITEEGEWTRLKIMLHHKRLMPVGDYDYFIPTVPQTG